MSNVSPLKDLSNYIYAKLPTSRLTQKTTLVAISCFAASALMALYRKPLYLQFQNLKMALLWRAEDYYQIALTLETRETTILPNGQTMSRLELLEKAYELAPERVNYRNALAYGLNELGVAARDVSEKKKLYVRALELYPSNCVLRYNVAFCLKTGESIQVNGIEVTKLALLEKAHELAPNLTYIRNALADELNELGVAATDVSDKKKLFLRALELDPSNGVLHYNVAYHLESEKSIQVNGTEMTKLALLEKAYELAPDNIDIRKALAYEYNRLGLAETDVARQRQLFHRALELDPQNPVSLCNVACKLKDDETIQWEGKAWSNRQLYLRAITVASFDPEAYWHLSQLLAPSETIVINEIVMTKLDLLQKAYERGPDWGYVALDLASELNRLGSETADLSDRKMFFLRTLELLNPFILGNIKEDLRMKSAKECAIAFWVLSKLIGPSEKIQALGIEMTKQNLLVEANKLDRNNIEYQKALAWELNLLGLQEKDVASQLKLLLRALQLDPQNAVFYHNVGWCLEKGKTIEINGKNWTQRELYLKAIELDSKLATPYYTLGMQLDPTETILVIGKEMNKLALLEKAHELAPDNIDFRTALAEELNRLGIEATDLSVK